MNTTENTCSREDWEREYSHAREHNRIGVGVPDGIVRQVARLMPGGCSIESIELYKGGPTYSVELFDYYSGEVYFLYNYNPRTKEFKELAWRARSGRYVSWQWGKQYKKRKR